MPRVFSLLFALAGAACSSGTLPGPLGALDAAAGPDGATEAGVADAAADVAIDTNPPCNAYVPPPSFDAGTAGVRFTQDVLPIFGTSCAFSSCHGATKNPEEDLYLGSDAARVYANLVGVSAEERKTMLRVAPGDAAGSFLLHKIDGDTCTLPACIDACTTQMPQGEQLLAEADRLTIRAWILQGAPSDLPDAGADAGTSDAAGGDAGDASTSDQ